MTKYEVRAKNTKRVTHVLAEALGFPTDGEEKRCGKWGFHIGNLWAATRKELHAKALELLEVGAGRPDWEKILRTAKFSSYEGDFMFRTVGEKE